MRSLLADRRQFAHDGVLSVFDRGREHEAGDWIAVRQKCFNQCFEVGEIGRGHLEEKIVPSREVVALADLFKGLNVFEQAVVILPPQLMRMKASTSRPRLSRSISSV